jgi:hypothetical protein
MQEAELHLSKGDWVFHPRMPGWGYGKILEATGGNKGRVFFLLAGEKKMSWEHAGLVLVKSDNASQAALNGQLAEFKLNLATDLLTTVGPGGGVTCIPSDSTDSRCELCKCSSENLRSYSLEKKGKMCICDACRDKIMLETGDKAGLSDSIAKMDKKGKKETTDKVAKRKIGKK